MTAKYTIKDLYKIAANKENQELRDSFIESFPLENPRKAASIADQWYLAYRDTQEYDSWRGLPTLSDVIQATKEVRPIQRESEDSSKNIAIALAEKYPEANPDIFELNPKFLSWVNSRWGDNSIAEEIHPIRDSIATLIRYQGKISDIRQKANDNPEFALLLRESFGERNLGNIKSFSVDDMEKIMSLSERKRATSNLTDPNYEPEEFIGQFGEWKLWMPITREDSIYIAQFNRDTLAPDTTWCTARTSGSNLFYSYATSEVLLFYVIKDGASCQDDEAFQSIGYKYGRVIEGVGVTVNRANNNKYEEDHKKIFGSQFDAIYSAIKNKAEAIGGEHPVKEKFRAAAIDKKVYEDMIRGVEPDGVEGINRIITDERHALATNESTPPEILGVLAEISQPGIRDSVARNPGVTTDILKALAKDDSREVRMGVAESENVPVEILAILAKDRDDHVRLRVARNLRSTVDILSILIKDELFAVRHAAAQHSNITIEHLKVLARDESVIIRATVAKNPATTSDILSMFGEDAEPDIRRYTASSQKVPAEVLAMLANDESNDVKRAVAQNPKTPADTLGILAKNEDPKLIIDVARNENTPPEALAIIAVDSVNYRYRRWSKEVIDEVALNLNTPGETLRMLSKEFEPSKYVFYNPNTPADVFLELTKDESVWTRRDIAESLSAPVEALRILAGDDDDAVRMHVAENKNIPVDILRMLAEDDSAYVRKGVASNPSTPTDILSILARSEVYDIKRGVAGNPSVSFEDLYMLANDESRNTREVAWENIRENWKKEDWSKFLEKNSSLYLKIKKLSSWLYKAELRKESEKILKLIK